MISVLIAMVGTRLAGHSRLTERMSLVTCIDTDNLGVIHLLELGFTSEKLLPLLVNFALHLKLNLSELLLLTSELLFLQLDGLGRKIFGIHGTNITSVTNYQWSETQGGILRRSTTLHGLGKLLCSVVLIEEVVGDLLEIGKVGVQQSRSDRQEV